MELRDCSKGYKIGRALNDPIAVVIAVRLLSRAGITELAEGQRVAVDMVEGGKGPEAVSIRLI
jgi:cold shock CspA family protein